MFSVRDVSHKYASKDLGLIELSDEQISQIQETTLGIYRDIVAVCAKYGIKAILGGGSALGAVRHKGFIPWDDDMDLMMSRKDFDLFMRIFKEELGEKYYMACPHKEYSNQYIYIVKVIHKDSLCYDIFAKEKLFSKGIAIDLGAIDSVPDNTLLYYIKGWISILILFVINSNMMYHCRTDISDRIFFSSAKSSIYYCLRLFIGFASSIFSYEKWTSFFDKFISSTKSTKRVSIPSGRNHYFKETQLREVFFPLKQILFEDIVSFVPNDVDKYLQGLYGPHYMEIPPENKREKHLLTKFELRIKK